MGKPGKIAKIVPKQEAIFSPYEDVVFVDW
jgi:hypothetical protein